MTQGLGKSNPQTLSVEQASQVLMTASAAHSVPQPSPYMSCFVH